MAKLVNMENGKPFRAKMVNIPKNGQCRKLMHMVNDKRTSANMVKLGNGKTVKEAKPVGAPEIGKMLKQAGRKSKRTVKAARPISAINGKIRTNGKKVNPARARKAKIHAQAGGWVG